MKSKIVFVFSFITLVHDCLGVLQCSVTDQMSKEEKQCAFPFVLDSNPDFENIECTNQNDPDGRYWCSTKVSQIMKRLLNRWTSQLDLGWTTG